MVTMRVRHGLAVTPHAHRANTPILVRRSRTDESKERQGHRGQTVPGTIQRDAFVIL